MWINIRELNGAGVGLKEGTWNGDRLGLNDGSRIGFGLKDGTGNCEFCGLNEGIGIGDGFGNGDGDGLNDGIDGVGSGAGFGNCVLLSEHGLLETGAKKI